MLESETATQLDRAAVIARIKECGAIAIIRTATTEQALDTVDAVIAGGFKVIEITYGVPNATSARSLSLVRALCRT